MDKYDKNKQIKQLEKYLRSYTTYKVGLLSLRKQLDNIVPSGTATYELAEASPDNYNVEFKNEKNAIERKESTKVLKPGV